MLKTIGKNAEIGKKVVNSNGVLYQINPKYMYSRDAFNVIYVNGCEYEHYTTDGKGTNALMLGQKIYGHDCDCYNDMLRPYGFSFRVTKGYKDSSITFANSLKAMINYFDIQNVILIGKGYGANIACRLCNMDNVKKIICINPDLLGSPLADYTEFRHYEYKGICEKFIKFEERKKFREEMVSNSQFAYTMEKAHGFNGQALSNVKKTTIYGGIINNIKPRNPEEIILKKSADFIQRVSGKLSDGVVTFDIKTYQDNGIEVIEMPYPYHSNIQSPKYIKKIMEDALNKI